MGLTAGTRIGSYEILGALGAGGMGEVYRARDTRLGREVALKILPHQFASDADRLARFEREAQVLAALNHPNIAHIHGVEESNGVRALVMELVEGRDLSELIAGGPDAPRIAIDEVLSIAKQIAEALEAAHDHGIIHRDLKPANVKLRDDGTVKVLDFGLAKALDPTAGSNAEAMNSPTMTVRGTQMGMIIGTAAYMAPEQAKGRVVDRRADIWSFGVVLTELLTGDRAFKGEDVTEVLAKVIEREPDLSKLPAATPPSLRRLIERCLIKDPKQRLRDIGEARLALAEAERELARGPVSASGTGTPASMVRLPVWRRALPWALVAVLLPALAFVLMRDRSPSTARPAAMRLHIALPPGVEIYRFSGGSMSLSPDGLTLAFVGVKDGIRRVFLRRLDQFEITQVPSTDTAVSCVFSPDGRELLVFVSDSSLHRVRLSDGLNQTIAETTSAYWATWLPNGQVVFTKDNRLWLSGGTKGTAPTQLTDAQAGSTATDIQPAPVPGGKAVLFVSGRPEAPDGGRIEALTLAGRVRTPVVERASSPVLTSSGDLLFLREGLLYAVPFDVQSLKTTGEATPVLRDVSVVRARGASSPIMTVSETGALAYASTTAVPSEIVSVSRTREERVLRSTDRSVANPRLSRDETLLVYEEVGNGLWSWDAKRPAPARLADGDTSAQFPLFTRDGRAILFRTPSGLFRQSLDGGAKPVRIAGSDTNEFPSGTTLHDADVLYTKVAINSGDINALPLSGGKPRALVSTPAYEGGAQVSPDGKWIAYVSNELGNVSEIFLKPYPSLQGRTQVSSGGGIHPVWNPMGGEILYRNGDKMMSVRLTGGTPELPQLTAPETLFSGRYAFGNGNTIPNFSMTSDGKRFILVKESGVTLNVVLNWFDELRRVR